MNPSLTDLGWSEHFAAQLAGVKDGLLPGRAAFESHGIYQVLLEDGEAIHAELKGKLRQKGFEGAGARASGIAQEKADFPVVGDWLLIERTDKGRGRIHQMLARRNALERRELGRTEATRRSGTLQVLAANVDLGLIATSMDEDLNERRIERYLGIVREAGITPLILLTKADLVEDQGLAIEEALRPIIGNAACLRLSLPAGLGIEALAAALKGKTAVLLGSSGVGKSSLANALLGREAMATALVRESDSKGRHTTTGRHLLALPGGGCLIDSPGLRELGIVHEAGVAASFDDIEALARSCRYSDCGHSNEPGCAVLAAVDKESLDPGRLASYFKLRGEVRDAARQAAKRPKRR